VPALDILKLTSHAVCINKEIGEESNPAEAHDENITGFIVRKCFHLLRENFNKSKFYVEEHVITSTTQLCFSVSPYCLNPATVLSIFHSLSLLKKL
jgi:hypothetical protein